MALHPGRVTDTLECVSKDGTTILPRVAQTTRHTHIGQGTHILTFIEVCTVLTTGSIYVLAGGKICGKFEEKSSKAKPSTSSVTCFRSLSLTWVALALFSHSAMLFPCPPEGSAVLSCLSTDSSSSTRFSGELQQDWNKGGDAGPPHPPDCGVDERVGASAAALGVSGDGEQ